MDRPLDFQVLGHFTNEGFCLRFSNLPTSFVLEIPYTENPVELHHKLETVISLCRELQTYAEAETKRITPQKFYELLRQKKETYLDDCWQSYLRVKEQKAQLFERDRRNKLVALMRHDPQSYIELKAKFPYYFLRRNGKPYSLEKEEASVLGVEIKLGGFQVVSKVS